MTPQQKQAVKDYVDERLQLFEADPKKTYFLYIQHLERILDKYTIEVKDDRKSS